MNHQKAKLKQQLRRRHHVRRNIAGTVERPRLSVFRSSKHIYAQLIDDVNSVTLAAVSSLGAEVKSGGNIKAAQAVGKKLAEVAKEKGIVKAAFDRGHYKYHGRVKALAEAATQGGLICCNPEKIGAAAKPAPKEAAAEAPKAPKKEKKEKKEAKETKTEA
jgi:large subunit ribosomal protein L18